MRIRPKPSEMLFLKGPRGRLVHLSYVEKTKERTLCGAKQSIYQKYSVFKTGKVTCKGCLKRLKIIQSMIRTWGIEWVCEGRWVPKEQRTFKDDFILN